MTAFFLRCLLVAPAQIILYSAAEKHVFLKHHGHRAAQGFELVIFNISASDENFALVNVIQPRNKLNESGFG